MDTVKTASDWVRATHSRLKTDPSTFTMFVCVFVVYHVCLCALLWLAELESQWIQ